MMVCVQKTGAQQLVGNLQLKTNKTQPQCWGELQLPTPCEGCLCNAGKCPMP